MQSKLYSGLIALAVSSLSIASEVPDPDKLLQIEGLIALQYDSSRGESGRFGTDPYATLDLTLTPYKKLELYTLLLQTQDFEVDEAIVSWYFLSNNKLDLSFGRQYLPFGSYESKMVSDPLTQVLGGIRGEEVFKINTQLNHLSASAYTFEGTSSLEGSDKHDQGYGFNIGYEKDDYQIGVDYVSNLAESDQFSLNSVPRNIPGLALHSAYQIGRFTLIGEHITATRTLDPGDLNGDITLATQPSATHFEVDIGLNNDSTLAFSWTKTRDTEELEEETTRRYFGTTYSQYFYDHISGAIEIAEFTSADGTRDETVNLQVVFDF